ncbi:DEKNAAC104430 [Brettanomyces naardenensis]|uniref:DEKNAAC104430 n=1 Tax=Brettanomyces naardenensis TaxID=13370 RepID=A0A448YQT1_BRENA|nr:DEKNAAC104430 [Brettanomyces naardenensis]
MTSHIKSEDTCPSGSTSVECSLSGFELLNSSLLNKGSAFLLEERSAFNLTGLLPPAVNSLHEQVDRAYKQLHFFKTPLSKSDFCTSMRVQNKVLYYRLVRDHIKELLPIVYTPTEGDAIIAYSSRFRKPEGCFLDINDPDGIDDRLSPFGDSRDIDYIVISDSEGILGIGDQGVGGVRICVAKGSLMTLCGGLHPGKVLPVVLDVGTNNKKLIDDELYMGNRFARVRGKRYDEFVEKVMTSLHKRFPYAVIHFEDFGVSTARPVLERYRRRYACFNDDIQGTGVVAMASMSAALEVTERKLSEAQVLIFGAGSAGLGIADQIVNHMVSHGVSREQAHAHIHCVDRFGLILDGMQDVSSPAQMVYCDRSVDWEGIDSKNLVEIVRKIRPTVLIGCSTQPGAFTKAVVKEMYKYNKRPIIFPLSNPTRLCEVRPEDAMEWTGYNALVATGSPFAPVNGHTISENNNCVAFPGIGLGAVLGRCEFISDKMISAAVDELAGMSPAKFDSKAGLLPDLEAIEEISARIATAVILEALKEGVVGVEGENSPLGVQVKVPRDFDACLAWVRSQMWKPEYSTLVRV